MDHHVGAWRAGDATRARSSHPESPRVFVHTVGHTRLLSDVTRVSVGRRGMSWGKRVMGLSGLTQGLGGRRLDYPRGHLLLEVPSPQTLLQDISGFQLSHASSQRK